MRMDRLTTVAQQALAAAQQDAVGRGNPEVTGLHVLWALVDAGGGPVPAVLSRAGVDADASSRWSRRSWGG